MNSLPQLDCSYCHQNHNIKFCPKLLKKREEQEQLKKVRETDLTDNFPKLVATQLVTKPLAKPLAASSWAKLVKITGDPRVLQEVSNQNDLIKQQKEDAWQVRQQKQKENQKKYEERERIWQSAQPKRMYDKYGPNWFHKTEQTNEDCDEADNLRRDADYNQTLRDQEINQSIQEKEDLTEHNERTMTPAKFQEWLEEDMEETEAEYETTKFFEEASFMQQADPDKREIYCRTGIMESNAWTGPDRTRPSLKK